MQIACVLNRDGKFTPRWLKQFLEFSARSISLAQFGFQISPSVMDHSLPILIQAVVRSWGLYKLSVFLIVMKILLVCRALSGILCLFNLSCQSDCKFSSIVGIADCVCGILIWCKLGCFLFDSHCYDRSALPVFICWWFELVKIL